MSQAVPVSTAQTVAISGAPVVISAISGAPVAIFVVQIVALSVVKTVTIPGTQTVISGTQTIAVPCPAVSIWMSDHCRDKESDQR
ncbi:hypothetical protein DPMN_160409 [Dreissena polymorpha]|uniref:Uncharacterized protein n=1 Tax=Dreissena polymorpha TaxID=45954 RepID=A0A9D4ER62_DREPO|nr:hypothetical protein DPMN_160409 [Dreissena polymorpha]